MTTTQLTYRRRGGIALLAGAGLTIAASIVVGVAQSTTDVSKDLFRYPLSHGPFVGFTIFAAITHALILIGVVWLLRSGTIGQSRAVRTGLRSVVFGTTLLFVCEWASLPFADQRNSATWPTIVDAGFAVASVAVVLGMLGAGVASARQVRSGSWRRYAPLICGLLSLVVIPLQFTSVLWLGIAIYGAGYGLLGLVLFRDSTERSRVSTQSA
jgi:hypothetical protein